MPPRGHSSSSHSSRSHSSHRSSSRSRSHSSRSSYHGHSSSSHSSVSHRRSGPAPLVRPRVNQPRGFSGSGHVTSYRCRKHEYVFYPADWTDVETGTVYKKGYYDENGNHYETLILKHNQKYENVPLRCEYCGTTSVRDLTDDNETMTCENCGANMVIEAILDEPDEVALSYDYSVTDDAPAYSRRSRGIGVIVVATVVCIFSFVIMTMLGVMYRIDRANKAAYNAAHDSGSDSKPVSNVDIFGSTLYLKNGDDGYTISDSDDYDKVLYWDYSYESYYDKDTDCYVWYNTDVSPNLWQYWYEDISSDYGDYGWMEYEDGKWYIEYDEEEWIWLNPDKYDQSNLWHFDNASDVSTK